MRAEGPAGKPPRIRGRLKIKYGARMCRGLLVRALSRLSQGCGLSAGDLLAVFWWAVSLDSKSTQLAKENEKSRDF